MLMALAAAAFAADAPTPAPEARDAAFARGELALKRGDFATAAAGFARAVELDHAAGRRGAECEAWLRLAEAQQRLGAHAEALKSVRAAIALASAAGDGAQLARGRGALGGLYLALGARQRARVELEAASDAARAAKLPGIAAVARNNLGNALAADRDFARALAAYAEAGSLAAQAGEPALAARAQANAARASIDAGDPEAGLALVDDAAALARSLPASSDQAFLLINLARSVDRARALLPAQRKPLLLRSHALLLEAQAIAETTDDAGSQAWALGYLGALYAEEGRNADALELTRRASFQAQRAGTDASLYLWHAQAARLLRKQGDRDGAIAEYGASLAIVEKLRHALAADAGASSGSFRETLGPLYFELVDLLLERAAQAPDPASARPDLENAQRTVELLKAAELRNYFRDDCVDAFRDKRKSVAQASASAAIVYPVLLPDRIELLLSTSQGIERHGVPAPASAVASEVLEFRRLLEKRTTRQYLPHAQQLYRWLIAPIEPRLTALGATTLVFVPDASLRTIPMSALHDGERFLIERFAVAVTPGLELTDPGPIDRSQVSLFLGGLSESVQGFPALDHVPQELRAIQAELGGEILLDGKFVLPTIEKRLEGNPYSIVHIASHAEFEADASETFLLTHEGRMSMDQLADYVGLFRFRQTPLELIVLSACETAQGDEQAALGLAGIAVKAGARSAVGTLWKVNDVAASELIAAFYTGLRNPGVSRAAALRDAQRKLLADWRYRHPGYWSAFVLISDWL